MILQVTKYGNPVLRQKGARLENVTDDEIQKLIDDMFETMRSARGVGLAAQQVGKALQLTVIDVRGITDRPSTLELNGKPADVESFMPLVLINPEITPLNEPVAGQALESAEIHRPAELHLHPGEPPHLAARRVDHVGPDHRDRNHRHPGLQRQPGQPGLALVQPSVG